MVWWGMAMHRIPIGKLAICTLGLITASTARAQLWPLLFPPSADFDAARNTSRQLYEGADTKPGQSVEWTVPENGDSGKATVIEDVQLGGMPCRKVRYDFVLADPSANLTYTINWCHTPNGEWRIVS